MDAVVQATSLRAPGDGGVRRPRWRMQTRSVVDLVASHDVYIDGLLSAVFRRDGHRFGLATSVANNGRTEARWDLSNSAARIRAIGISIRRLVIRIRVAPSVVIRTKRPGQRSPKTESMLMQEQRVAQGWRSEARSNRKRSSTETARSTVCLVGNERKTYRDHDRKAGGIYSHEHRTHHFVRCPAASNLD